jgi:NhaP-type Na+/H+ or K+/H+ antiporter
MFNIGMVIRLAFTPCLVETIIVGISSRILFKYALQYEFPWLWGFLLGFVLAAVSPAVVVPSLLELQEKGYGVSKGIPTLVIAAASVDDVLAISGFSILLGLAFQGGIFPVASHSVGTLSTPTVTGMSEIVNTTNSSNYELLTCEDEQGCNSNVAIAVFQASNFFCNSA